MDFFDDSQKRIQFLSIAMGLVVIGLTLKLFHVSIIEHQSLLAAAENQYIYKKDIPANRGKIYLSEKNVTADNFDNNFPVALNEEKYDVNATPKNIKDPKKVAKELATALNLDENTIFSLIDNQKPYIPPITKSISKEAADKVLNLKLAGVFLTPEESRIYPENSLAGQVLGFVNADGKGQYGVEGSYNDLLLGKSGMQYGTKDTNGQMIDLSDTEASQNGSDILLTLDHNIQFMAERKLQEGMDRYQCESGSIVIMDPKTGAILAMTSKPDYNPNDYINVAKTNQSLFMNPAISSLYEPGSTMKTIIMAGGIDQNVVQPDTEQVFGADVTIGQYTIHTAEDKAFGKETMTDVLVHSDNVAMVWLAGQMGKDTMYDYITKFGLGAKTNIELDGEQSGVVRDKKQWHDINTANFAFGQGISVTPLQMVSAYQVIANGGKLMQPYIIKAVRDSSGDIRQTESHEVRQAVTPDTANKLTAMMVEVVKRGTGRHANVPGYLTAAKTGTAQVPDPAGGYFGDDIKIGSLIGFAPAGDPKYVMIVKLDKPKLAKWGETSAGPIFGEMNQWLLNYFEVRPTEPVTGSSVSTPTPPTQPVINESN